MLSAFLNVKYDHTDSPTVWFRRYSENKWTKYIDTHVSFSKNDWNEYTEISIPTVVYNIPDNTGYTGLLKLCRGSHHPKLIHISRLPSLHDKRHHPMFHCS